MKPCFILLQVSIDKISYIFLLPSNFSSFQGYKGKFSGYIYTVFFLQPIESEILIIMNLKLSLKHKVAINYIFVNMLTARL